MAIVQALLAMVFRSAGKILNTAFGWATVMLFGKVPQDRQIHLSIIAFGSVAWIVVLLGIAFPGFATFLLTFVPLPAWLDRAWVRLAMLAAAVVIPPVVGVVSLLMLEPERRPQGVAAKAKAVLKGYPYTLGLAITLIMMTTFAPVMKVRNIVRRWTSQHVPVIVESADYLEVVGDIQKALSMGGLKTERQRASGMLRLPTKVLTFFAGGAVEDLVADQLTTLKSSAVEVLLHPSDLVISGRELDAARAHAIITEQLTFTKAYLTWDKEANQLEDRLRAIWCELKERRDGSVSAAAEKLHAVERDLRCLKLPYEEWEVLFREKLLVERSLLQLAAGVADEPKDLTEERAEEMGAAKVRGTAPRPRRAAVPLAGALTALAALALRRLDARGERRARGLLFSAIDAIALLVFAGRRGKTRSA
jgi:hypothetical protein